MASNRGVVYLGPGKVEVQSIDFPKMRAPDRRDIHHGSRFSAVAGSSWPSRLQALQDSADSKQRLRGGGPRTQGGNDLWPM
jgi:hypothetical protein